MGLMILLWGTVMAVIGAYVFPAVSESLPAVQQVAQVAGGDGLHQTLTQEQRPTAVAGIKRLGSGLSISVDAGSADQVKKHNLSIVVGQLDLLQQVIPIRIHAEYANTITPIIRNERTLEETRLRSAKAMGGGQWVYDWPVADVPAGKYRVQLEVVPQTGNSFMVYDGNVYELPSYEKREAALRAGRESVQALYESLDDIQSAVDAMPAPEPQLRIPSADRAVGGVVVYLDTTQPAMLEIQTASGSWQSAGRFQTRDGLQQVTLETTEYADGWHALRALASNTGTVLTATKTIRISNHPKPVSPARILTVKDKVRTDSALNDARVDFSDVITVSDVAVTATIPDDVYANANDFVISVWSQYRNDINQFSDRLAVALRGQEKQTIERAKQRFRDLEADIMMGLDGRQQAVIDAVQGIVRNRLNERILRIEQAEHYVAYMVAQSNSTTTTATALLPDPTVSFYATTSSGEQMLPSEYKEPRTSGVTRDDLLQVTKIATTSAATVDDVNNVLHGTALPNATVQLFIYSNPVVVTLNTNADGTWEYQFDTEMEDGEHEVYVALTDGWGQVVAKSNPFGFVKTAQAFSPVDRVVVGQVSQTNQTGVSMMNWPLIYLIVSLSVVVIGFLLMVLGMTVRGREDKRVVIKTKIIK